MNYIFITVISSISYSIYQIVIINYTQFLFKQFQTTVLNSRNTKPKLIVFYHFYARYFSWLKISIQQSYTITLDIIVKIFFYP